MYLVQAIARSTALKPTHRVKRIRTLSLEHTPDRDRDFHISLTKLTREHMEPLLPSGLEQDHIQYLWSILHVRDRAAFAVNVASISPAEREILDKILSMMLDGALDRAKDSFITRSPFGVDGALNGVRDYFVMCSTLHFQKALELCTKFQRDFPGFQSRVQEGCNPALDDLHPAQTSH